MRGYEGAGGKTARSQRTAGIEPEPSHPEQTRSDKAQYHAVREHGLLRISEALAEINRANQSRNTRCDVDHRAASKIERRETPAQRGIQETSLAPNHVRHRIVDDDRPQNHEQQHGAE